MTVVKYSSSHLIFCVGEKQFGRRNVSRLSVKPLENGRRALDEA